MIYAKKGMVARLVYLVVSCAWWLLTCGGRIFSSRKVILCYHGIMPDHTARFFRQMQYVSSRAIAVDDDSSAGKGRFSPPAVVVTFDDDFENLLTNALHVTDDLEIPVSIYVVSGCLGEFPCWLRGSGHPDERERLMSREQIIRLSRNPLVHFGLHTHSHPRLTDLDPDDVGAELGKSKQALETLLGRAVSGMAFPHGAFNKSVVEQARRLQLSQLLTLEEQMVPLSQTSGLMGRFSMEPDVWPIEFRLTVNGAYAWLYYFRGAVRFVKRMLGRGKWVAD